MKKVFILVFLAIMLCAAAFYFYIRYQTAPIYQGQIRMPQLKEPVHVYYDNYGIPHIRAENRADLYKAYGYVVMQDRFFQIQMQKMIASGRLSEWFGGATLPTDKVLRNLGAKHYMSQWLKLNLPKINPQLVKDLKSWLIGVNECVKKCPRPIELILLREQPEEITMEDVLAFSAVMSFTFTKNYFSDALLSQLARNVQGQQLDEIVGTTTSATLSFATKVRSKSLDIIDPLNYLPQMDGSQSWVISPQKSVSGFATLANDPHIGYSNPGVWYEAHLKSPDFELYGHFVPIIPFALIGHNLNKAWALTMSYTDDLDLLRSSSATQIIERTEILYVKNGPALELKLQDTPHGPIINELLQNKNNTILDWHYYHNDNYIIESFYDLALAENLDQFYSAVKKGKAPGLNISWADKSGNIAWKILGYFPFRKEPFWKIRDTNNQTETLPDSQVPSLENPEVGYILSANQKPPIKFDEKNVVGFWDRGERYAVLNQQLQSKEKIDLDFQRKLFVNNTFLQASDRLKKMLSLIQGSHEVVQMLNQWNGEADIDNQAQGFYHMWLDEIARAILGKYFDSIQFEQFCSTPNYWKFILFVIDHPQSTWWDNQRQSILQSTFEKTLNFFSTKFGNTENWKWGKLHTVEYEHPLGKLKILRPIFNLGPYPAEGGSMIPNAFRHKFCSSNFNVTGGASTRRLIDFKNPAESWGILPTGNSGSPFSKHYGNQVDLYLRGELRPQIMNWDAIQAFKDHLEFIK